MDTPPTTTVKRKRSWSYDSGEADTTRARLRLSSALTSTISESDDNGGADANNEAQNQDDASGRSDSSVDPNSLMRPITEQKRRKSMTWPNFSITSHDCCQKCEAMTSTPEGLSALLSDSGYKHLNWYELQKTIGGCELCHVIWDITEHQDWDCDNDGSVTRAEIRIFANVTRLSSSAKEVPSSDPLKDIQLHSIEVMIPLNSILATVPKGEIFNLVTFEADTASSFVPGRRESKELSSRAIQGINRWLDECFDQHTSCPQRCTPELPRRVLDIGTDNSPIQLHQSQRGEKAQYATLSYCWGSGVGQLTTTTSNICDHICNVPNSLPQTVLDAVQVCRTIGIRYLWVDALCIIQDSDSDKHDQISKMGSIYKNSTVTIVAASAEEVTNGFLSNGKRDKPIAQLPLFINESTSGTIYLRVKDGERTFDYDEPIFHRAWTFQELLLSPRALVFDSYQINYKCLENGFRPLLKTYLEFDITCFDLPASVFSSAEKNLAERRTEEVREWFGGHEQTRIWTRIISEYSMRDISFFEDRLPALAGIATELASSWNDIYIAGFWHNTIAQQLGWYRREITWPPDGPKWPFRGVDCTGRIGSPSWSWATVPYPVHVQEIKSPDVQLVSSNVIPRSKTSPFGQVEEAFIVLEARVLSTSNLELKFCYWPTQLGEDNILLDFEHPKPNLECCRLIYLGKTVYRSSGSFLVVEESTDGEFRRVGYAELSEWTQARKNILPLTTRETIVIR